MELFGFTSAITKALLQYIRQNYLEIDIDELNSAAWNRYL